jgi:hypothetical protein
MKNFPKELRQKQSVPKKLHQKQSVPKELRRKQSVPKELRRNCILSIILQPAGDDVCLYFDMLLGNILARYKINLLLHDFFTISYGWHG